MIRYPTLATLAISLVVSGCGAGGGSGATGSPSTTANDMPLTPTAPRTVELPKPTIGSSTQRVTLPDEPSPSSATPARAWTEVETADGPSAREDHTWTLAADGVSAYLFGGRSQAGPSDELWQFDLRASSWAKLEPQNLGPEARFGHTATWVADVGLVVWSGQGTSGFFDDIWQFQPSDNMWTKLNASGAVPEARYGSCAALGPDNELWISHGFTQDSGRFSDTHSYNFATATWTDRTPQDEVPLKRCLHDCFWSAEGELILYGGQTTGVPALGDLWAFDLGTRSWTQASDQPAAPRQLYGLASNGHSAVVYGGGSIDRGYLDDTWRLDPAALRLTALEVGSAPSPRSGAALVAEPAGGQVLLFGGQGDGGLLGDTWLLSGAL